MYNPLLSVYKKESVCKHFVIPVYSIDSYYFCDSDETVKSCTSYTQECLSIFRLVGVLGSEWGSSEYVKVLSSMRDPILTGNFLLTHTKYFTCSAHNVFCS